MLRVFFTGAFRRPREPNWLIGVGLLIFAIGMGFTGYSLPDDLLSGNGLRIAYSVMLSIPFAGPYLASLIFGGEFPAEAIISRLFVMHIMLLPALIIGLISVHLAILVRQKHAQFRGPGRSERNVVGKPLWPSQTFKSLALLFLTASIMAFMGGLLQINPVWNYGPFKPYITSAPSQPDWYVGWLDGGLRLFPGWDLNVFGITIAAPFIPGVLVPGLLFTVLALWPFIEARMTGDRAEHQLLDHPRDMPLRTAIGVAGIVFFTVLTLEGGGDVLSITFNIPVEAITNFFRAALFVIPAAAGMLTYRICTNLRGTEFHPFRRAPGVRLRRTPDGGFEEV
jgi:ubiquinol-cytochrome c reductase cytochrome b subunit